MRTRSLGILSLVLALAATGFVAATARGQCPTPDGLDGPCCTAATPVLPSFPDIDVGMKYICWTDCNPALNVNLLASTKHFPAACGYRLIRFDITNMSGSITVWQGKMIAAYSRTWVEMVPPSTNIQVWRFLINGDLVIDPLIATTYATNTCIVPPSYATYGKIHATGYIDYAFNCDTGTWSIAFALGHECDPYEHTNPYSARPGFFSNFKTYNWVGPSAGFVIDAGIPPADGDIVNEGMRNFDFTMPLSAICETEQPVGQGVIEKFDEFCRCSSSPSVAPQVSASRMSAVSLCGSFGLSTDADVWVELQSKSIGHWTDPTFYPGPETLHLEQGFFDYTDACTGVTNQYFFKGVHTQMGYPTFKFMGTTLVPVSDRLIDLGSAIPWPPDPTVTAIGQRYVSDRMMHLNVD